MNVPSWQLRVETPSGEYDVALGPGCRRKLGEFLRSETGVSNVFLVADANADRHHGAAVFDLVQSSGRPAHRIVIPAGEAAKSPEGIARLWSELAQRGCDRSSLVVALGGGVVGDLAGFAAATVLRGIGFVQVPTTLLAMVDASVGGKTGIDLPEGKNLVGAFHQPRAVFVDPDFLETLPDRELRAGWAEALKTAAIRDAGLFEWMETEREALLRLDRSAVAWAVRECIRIKAEVVGADEKESGLRQILNFGHTLGHAIEAASGYSGWLHGEAVAVGMCFAGRLGEALEVTAPGTLPRLRATLEAFGLPVTAKGRLAGRRRVLEAMARDKKRGAGGLRWVLLSELGNVVVQEGVPDDLVGSLLDEFLDAD